MRVVRLLLFHLVLAGCAVAAEPALLDRLFTRPFAWGVRPQQLVWAKSSQVLVFLWNEDGAEELDLYAYDVRTSTRRRITNTNSFIASFDVSPAGDKVSYETEGDIWVASTGPTPNPTRFVATDDQKESPQFRSTGNAIAFLKEDQVFLLELSSGQMTQLTHEESGRVTSFQWSPDGTRIAYAVEQASGRTVLIPEYSGKLTRVSRVERSIAGDNPPLMRFYVLNLANTESPTQLEPGAFGTRAWSDLPKWSPDSTMLAGGAFNPRRNRFELLAWDAESGRPKEVALMEDPAWVEKPAITWSPDSKQLLFTCDHDGYRHLYRASVSQNNPEDVTEGNWEIDAEKQTIAPQWIGNYIYFTSNESGAASRNFYRVEPTGQNRDALTAGHGIQIGLMSPDAQHRALLKANSDAPLELFVDGKAVTQTPARFNQITWPRTTFVEYPSAGGRTVHARMMLPENYAKKQNWPAVVYLHGAGYASSVLEQWGSYDERRYAFNCYLAQQGYVVIEPDYSGSAGYGRDHRTAIHQHLGGTDLEDVVAAVAYLAKSGRVDPKRVGIWGASYGGFLTTMALFQHPGVFRAGAAWAPVSDWTNYNAEYTVERLGLPARSPESYRRSSPILFSNNLQDPLLLVHGMADANVLFQDTAALTRKLIDEGKRFSEIFYPDESHSFSNDATLRDAFRRTAEWFNQHLQ